MSDVQKSIVFGTTKKNSRKPSWLTTNMIVAYALPVIEVISFIYMEADITSKFKMWKDAMMEEMNSLHKNDTWELLELSEGKKAIDCK